VNLLKVVNLENTRKQMPSTLSNSLESRSNRDRFVLGDGEFEVTDSILEYFRDEVEDGNVSHQELAVPFASSTRDMGSSPSRTGWS
jgi:hypothetical protein